MWRSRCISMWLDVTVVLILSSRLVYTPHFGCIYVFWRSEMALRLGWGSL